MTMHGPGSAALAKIIDELTALHGGAERARADKAGTLTKVKLLGKQEFLSGDISHFMDVYRKLPESNARILPAVSDPQAFLVLTGRMPAPPRKSP